MAVNVSLDSVNSKDIDAGLQKQDSPTSDDECCECPNRAVCLKKIDLDAIREQQLESRHEQKKQELELKKINSDLKDKEQLRNQRHDFALYIFYFMCVCMVFIFSILAFCIDRMSESVLIALIGSGTANVIALMMIVANYMFPKNNGTTKKNTK